MATGLSAGTASVTITDQNGCQAFASVTLNAPAPISLSFTTTDVSCNGGVNGSATVSANGGTPGYTYLWSNGPTTASNLNLNAGTYSVTVTDANGCTASGSVTVTEPAPITLTATLTSPSCNGVANGTAALNPSGGTPPYSYLWSNGQQSISATSLTAGPWSVTVTDANGCQDSLSVVLTEPSALTISTNAVTVSCNGGSDGTVSATPMGGTSPYTYQWSNSATTAIVGNLASGAYSVTVTDANGCSVVETVVLGEPTVIQLQISGSGPGCNGGSDGSALVTASGGSPGYAYLWSNGQATTQATGLSSGMASVTVTDQNGCTSTSSINLSGPGAIALTGTATDVSCAGGANGTASVAVVGGTPGYSYSWSNGAQSASASGLSAGNYTVQVTDVNGCTASISVTVQEPLPMTLQLSGEDISCFGELDGTAQVTAGGGILPYSYAWSGGQTTSAASGLGTGWQSVLVTDANGCSIRDSILLHQPDPLTVIVSGPDRVCLGSRALLDAQVLGGTSAYSYAWTSSPAGFTANTAQISAIPVVATAYLLTVTDAHGCRVQTSHSVTVAPLPNADFDAENLSGCDTVTARFSNLSTGAMTYLWDFGDGTTSTLENPTHQFGNGIWDVTLVVISAEGCRDSIVRQDLVTVLPTPIADFSTQEDISQAILLSQAEIHFLNNSQFATTYFWEFGDGYISPETNPVHSYQEPGSYPVTLYAYNEFGCVDSITKNPILIDPDGSIFAPTAFSPNNDGLNDEFLLKGEGITSYQLVIFNRWGQQVYISRNINNSWDGKFKGNPSPEGVYIWKLEASILSGKEVNLGGSLTLIR
jgi:gliding motility-associated-like protein